MNEIIVDGSWYPGRLGMGIFDPLCCWYCFVAIFPPSWYHLVQYPRVLQQPYLFLRHNSLYLGIACSLESSGRKHFSFKHASMGITIFILVVFQVLAAFNRPHPPPTPDTKRGDEDMEGVTSNEDPISSPGKSKICIAWEILHRLFGEALMAYRY